MIPIASGTNSHRQRDEAGEPEERGEEQQDEGRDRMAELGEAERHEEVC